MAAKLTPAERETLGSEAWQLSLRGKSAPQIALQLATEERPLSEKTVDSLLKRESRRIAKERETERAALLARFEGEQDAVIEDAWDRLGNLPAKERTGPDFQSNILTASVNKAKANGLFVDQVEHSGEVIVRRYIGVDFDAI